MDEKVKIKEEKTDGMIEISIDLPPNPKIHEPSTSCKEKSERTNEKLMYQQLKRELQRLKEDLAQKEAEIEQLKNDNKKAISVTKRKQWCYVCGLEAKMHCCWNTSYCAIECQAIHWGQDHKDRCQRKRTSTGHQIAGS